MSIGRALKGGWGFHPLMAWCDNSGELLAIIARPGDADSNTALRLTASGPGQWIVETHSLPRCDVLA